ncbi:hypothetical protein JXA88_03620 [Candidatus Fermentibacteria bacterium]|nr:hypothetical protein [Candidatus Fermentibacteria bacterium]
MSTFVRRGERGISRTWVIASMIVFLMTELVIGTVVGSLFAGHPGHVVHMRIEMLVMLASYFVGGLVMGFVSRGSRLDEPIIAAFLAVVITFCLTLFTPLRFFRFSVTRVLIGGVIAAGFAVAGVDLGARAAAGLSRRTHRDGKG